VVKKSGSNKESSGLFFDGVVVVDLDVVVDVVVDCAEIEDVDGVGVVMIGVAVDTVCVVLGIESGTVSPQNSTPLLLLLFCVCVCF